MGTPWFYQMDDDGETPMSRAVKSGHVELTLLMLRQLDDDNPDIAAGDSLLQRAAYWGLESAMRKLLKAGADPSERDKSGETPLHKAARRGHQDVVEILLNEGADANIQNNSGMTTLHWIALNGRKDIAQVLIQKGASINERDKSGGGLTPFAMAKLMGYETLAEYLGEQGGTW